MKNFLKIMYLLIVICLYSCITAKGADGKDDKDNSLNLQVKNMEENGFVKGSISTNKSTDCPYILTIENLKEQLDPINLNEFFKNEIPENVWVKYSNLKRMNRCNDARPVSLREISKRTD